MRRERFCQQKKTRNLQLFVTFVAIAQNTAVRQALRCAPVSKGVKRGSEMLTSAAAGGTIAPVIRELKAFCM